ncbi:protein LNK1 isoform X2 [Ricinus communis]|uniref:protein LNK1 isoform X2 n=1 Tax=Ricinus communis TaxID=3988 RepID=UPI00201A483B|nr:protein LNK1 isoform X2 [Ricinus communis]
MSDLCMYELEDNVWDEFSESDDHIVPHPTDDCGDQFRVHGDDHKKPRREIIGVASNIGDATKYIQKKEEANLHMLTKKDRMLDKASWSHTPDGVFPGSCDSGSVKEVASIASEATRASNQSSKTGNSSSVGGEFADDDPIFAEKSTADDNDTYRFPLSHISQTNNDLNFFDNDHEVKESSDLLYYGWPDDIGNFEDVDRMFRSCDSTFGLESLTNEDDLCWFSSSRSTEGSEDASKLVSRFSSSEASALDCISEHHEASRLNNAGPSVNVSNKKSLLMGDKTSSNNAGASDHSGFAHYQFSNGSDARSVRTDNSMLKEQISSHKSHGRHRNYSEGKRKERNLDSDGSFHHNGNFKQVADAKCSFGDPSPQSFSSPHPQHRKPDLRSDSLDYMQTNIPYMNINYGHSSDQTSVCPSQSGIKSESNGLPSPSPKDSSFASNQLQSIESSHGPSLDTPAIINEKRERLYLCQDLQAQYARNFKCANIASPTALYDSVQNQNRQSDYEVECHSEIEEVSIRIPAELDSNAQESSCMSSALDEISLEATSFRQLQQVMEQLDIRTKLCIRDSLYRLARSAEQRHNCGNANGGKQDDRDTSGQLITEDTNKGTGFLDIETDTNPIDRSIAHLLFHRPSDPSLIPLNDALSLKSHTMDLMNQVRTPL